MTHDIDAALDAVDEASGSRGLFHHLDDATRRAIAAEVSWARANGGERLFRQGEVGDALYVVITGRLQAVFEVPGQPPRVIGDISRGEVVGEMAVLTGDPRSVTVRAVRDTTLVRFSKEAFERVTTRNPQAMLAITRRIIRRLEQRNAGGTPAPRVSTIAVIPVAADVDHRDVAERLVRALEPAGAAARLTRELVDASLAGLDEVAASRWLDDQERQHAFTVYVADGTSTPWTLRSVRQADRILLVANGDQAPDGDAIQRWTGSLGLRDGFRRVELVLLHASAGGTPRGTAQWLGATAATSHHHVRLGVPEEYERVARFLTGRAVGLVLGGGGARGFAHIGVIRALGEAGVPIDAVGGTSMGAIVAGQCAMGLDAGAMIALNRRHWIEHNPLKDKTLPVVALLAGHRLDRMVTAMFGETEIADLWRRYFCVSADLTRATLHVHDRGLLSRAARASMSLPGIAIPVYDAGSMLVDGGVLNNLPADIMKAVCGGTVMAVNVTPDKDLAVSQPYPEAISGWKLLLKRKQMKLPGILAIMMRTTMLASTHQRDRVAADIDLLLSPAVEQFGMFDWDKLDAIAQAGYDCARAALERWHAR
jgi:predicted acylesterase/phospholipase RssA/CRP-like cAMP-binding protein